MDAGSCSETANDVTAILWLSEIYFPWDHGAAKLRIHDSRVIVVAGTNIS